MVAADSPEKPKVQTNVRAPSQEGDVRTQRNAEWRRPLHLDLSPKDLRTSEIPRRDLFFILTRSNYVSGGLHA